MTSGPEAARRKPARSGRIKPGADMMNFDILEECKDARRIGISGHIRPDGDCTGACLALWQYLRKNLPGAETTVFLEKPPEIFAELKGFEEICSDFPEEPPFDVYFVLDAGEDRIGGAEKYWRSAGKKINIDHHVSNSGCGQLNHIRPEIGSVCEVLYDLMGRERLDGDIALAIYTGMIHDTGVFQYSNTTPDTLRKAAELIGYGFDFPRLILETFYQKSYVQAQIMGRTLTESVRYMDGRCIVGVVDKKTMEFYGAGTEDLDGIVSQLRNIRGVDCAVFLHQTDENEYKVSLRTDQQVNAAEVAARFGGGGHARAAGCTVKGSVHECVNALLEHIEEQFG